MHYPFRQGWALSKCNGFFWKINGFSFKGAIIEGVIRSRTGDLLIGSTLPYENAIFLLETTEDADDIVRDFMRKT